MIAEENIATIRRAIQALNDWHLSIVPQLVARAKMDRKQRPEFAESEMQEKL